MILRLSTILSALGERLREILRISANTSMPLSR